MTTTNATAELLAPAGNTEALDAAIGEGADAVYLGLKTFNARLRSSNFAFSQFEAATDVLHRMGKKIYVTVNTVFEQREADRMFQLLQYLEQVGPDGVIVQDFGIIKMAQDHFPKLSLHASTQMNVGSAAGANFLSRFGFKRVVLSRELSLAEIQSVKANTNMELETFVHGALCVSGSGVCLFSSYLGGRSANRGACTQACRRLFAAEESDNGYFFSPEDLQLIDKVPELVEAGVASFKIEGRMKSAEYVGTVVAAYRYMLDNWRFDREKAAAKAQSILKGDFARRKTMFWFDGTVEKNYIRPEQSGGTGLALGKIRVVRVFDDKRWMLVNSYKGLAEGDSLRIHSHDDSGRVTARVREVKEKHEGLFIQVDGDYNEHDEVYLVQTKAMSRRYKPILPAALAKYHKFPSYDTAPKPDFPAIPHDRLSVLPEGLYAMVSRVADMHATLTDRPAKTVIRFNRKNAEQMRKHEKELPYKRESLILWLEPFFPQGDAQWLEEDIKYWIGQGQKIFIVNNLGHLALLKGKNVTVIAGPWLYSFNSWAAAFVLGNGSDFLIPPLEISKQNYQRMAEVVPNKSLMMTVFAYPQLFTMRGNMSERYDFKFFRDRDGADYELVSDLDTSTVIAVKPFSLVDRIPLFKKDGLNKFMLDFSFITIKKQVYRRVMSAARDGIVLQASGRFNWKEGFWNPEEENAPKNTDSGERSKDRLAAVKAEKAVEAATVARDKARAGGERAGRGGKPSWYEKTLDAASEVKAGKSVKTGRLGKETRLSRPPKATRDSRESWKAKPAREGRAAERNPAPRPERPRRNSHYDEKPGSATKAGRRAPRPAGERPAAGRKKP